MTNCKNCGAPYQTDETSCRYCGSERCREELPETLKPEHFSIEMEARRLEAECDRLTMIANMRACEQVCFEKLQETATRGCQNVNTQTAINMLMCNVATMNEAREMCGLFNPLDKRMG